MASGYFTDVVLHCLKNYHQERATATPAIKGRRSRFWRCNFTFPRRFKSVQVVIWGICELEQRKMFCACKSWTVRLGGMFCGIEVVMICEFKYSRYNSSKGNVFCFGKLQQGIAFSALLQPCGQRCCRLPSVALVVPPLSLSKSPTNKMLLSQSAEGGVTVPHNSPPYVCSSYTLFLPLIDVLAHDQCSCRRSTTYR